MQSKYLLPLKPFKERVMHLNVSLKCELTSQKFKKNCSGVACNSKCKTNENCVTSCQIRAFYILQK